LIKVGPSEGKYEEVFSGLAILLLENENARTKNMVGKDARKRERASSMGFGRRLLGVRKKDRLNRLYLYGDAIPELGTLNTGYGLDDWYAAFLRENSDKTPDIIFERAQKYQDMYCGTRKPLHKEELRTAGGGLLQWEDAICPESKTDGTRECKISMQPELELHFKNILDYAAVNAPVYSKGEKTKPAREAQALLIDGHTGEILANAYYNIESEDKIFAPRFPKFKKWGDYVLDLDYARTQNNKTLKNFGCRLDDLKKEQKERKRLRSKRRARNISQPRKKKFLRV
jgi:hypothetical protein